MSGFNPGGANSRRGPAQRCVPPNGNISLPSDFDRASIVGRGMRLEGATISNRGCERFAIVARRRDFSECSLSGADQISINRKLPKYLTSRSMTARKICCARLRGAALPE